MRHDGRASDQLRPISIKRRFTEAPAGSVLWQQGSTIVWCTASITPELPPWMKDDRPGGWITAEYVMLPPSTPQRKGWPKIGHTDSRGTEIQRIIGRSLRAIVDLSRIGPHMISIDCQVLQADGGTRTAAICGAYIALVDALAKLPPEIPEPKHPFQTLPPRYDPSFYRPTEALTDALAAVSVGIVDGEVVLDLDYPEDAAAEVDLNVALTAGGKFVEVQGTAEQAKGFDRKSLDAMLDQATGGCRELISRQRASLGEKI